MLRTRIHPPRHPARCARPQHFGGRAQRRTRQQLRHLHRQGRQDRQTALHTRARPLVAGETWHPQQKATFDAEGYYLLEVPYPHYYLDFETIQFAVPIWPGTRPYQRLPFQWSCHIEYVDDTLDHEAFLGGLDGKAPMEAFTHKLIDTLNHDSEGPIFVYNQGFEAGCIRDLATTYPEHAEDLNAILARLVDLLPLTRESYYHPAMKGSWSLKAVLPTIAPDIDYAELDQVQHAGMVQGAFMEIVNPGTDPKRRERLIRSLEDYCHQDTLALVRLARFLADGKT